MAGVKFDLNSLYNYIVKIARKELNDTNLFDTVVTGSILESLPGYYTVQLTDGANTSSISAAPINSTDKWAVGDYVYLLKAPVSSGDYQTVKYYIFGLVNDVQETFANATDYERFQGSGKIWTAANSVDFKGQDLWRQVDDNGACWERGVTIANRTSFVTDVLNSLSIVIRGTFSCAYNLVKNYCITDYGIRIKFMKDSNVVTLKNKEAAIYDFGIGYFEGQPFNMTSLPQKRVITIEPDLDFNAIGVYIYMNGKAGQMPDLKSSSTFANAITINNITLEAGLVLENSNRFSAEISSLEGYENYINKEANNEFGLQATAYYDDQPLSADAIQYYWLIEDASVNSDSNAYLSYAGPGWRCLNLFTEAAIVSSNNEIVNNGVRIWSNKCPSLIVNLAAGESTLVNSILRPAVGATLLAHYKVKFKCIVKYQSTIVESAEYIVYNYSQLGIVAHITSNSNTNIIYRSADTITLTVDYQIQNSIASTPDVNYSWYKKAGDGWTKIGDTNSPLNIGAAVTNANYEKNWYAIANTNESVEVRAQVSWTLGDFNDEVLTDPVIIQVALDPAAEVTKSVYKYKYFISNSSCVEFEKIEQQTTMSKYAPTADTNRQANKKYYYWNEDQKKYIVFEGSPFASNVTYYEVETATYIDWGVYEGKNTTQKCWSNEIEDEQILWGEALAGGYTKVGTNYQYLDGTAIDTNKKSYLYYTKQEQTVEVGTGNVIEMRSWSKPEILRRLEVTIDDEIVTFSNDSTITTNELTQLNIFNALTNNNTEQGLFYYNESGEDHYILTKDETAIIGKTYYIKEDDGYKKADNLQNFATGQTYYEKTQQKLFINSEYIRTTTLQVGQDNEVKFYASVNNDSVTIAGFIVGAEGFRAKNDYLGFSSSENGVTLNEGDTTQYVLWVNKDGYEDKLSHKMRPLFYVSSKGEIRAESMRIGQGIQLNSDTAVIGPNCNINLHSIDIFEQDGTTVHLGNSKNVHWGGDKYELTSYLTLGGPTRQCTSVRIYGGEPSYNYGSRNGYQALIQLYSSDIGQFESCGILEFGFYCPDVDGSVGGMEPYIGYKPQGQTEITYLIYGSAGTSTPLVKTDQVYQVKQIF